MYCIFGIIVFLATEDTAKIFRDKFRAIVPIRYSARRQSDEPTPPTSPNDRSDAEPDYLQNPTGTNSIQLQETAPHNLNDFNWDQAAQTDSREIETENFAENSSNETPIGIQTETVAENSNEQVHIEVDSTSTTQAESSEAKNIMPNIEMGEEESFAIESVFNGDYDDENESMNMDSNASDSEDTDLPASQVNLAPGESAFWDNGVLKVKRMYDRDCEITYTYGEKVAPKVPEFEVKLNDPISLNIPFKENVSL